MSQVSSEYVDTEVFSKSCKYCNVWEKGRDPRFMLNGNLTMTLKETMLVALVPWKVKVQEKYLVVCLMKESLDRPLTLAIMIPKSYSFFEIYAAELVVHGQSVAVRMYET